MKTSYKMIHGLLVVALFSLFSGSLWAAEEESAQPAMPIKVSDLTRRPPANEQTIKEGRQIYERTCIYCHGVKGEGKGPVAYFLSRDIAPHPRDFTKGVFKFKSTASGEPPAGDDLFRTITKGIPGFMPPFASLESADRWKLVYYIKSLAPEAFEVEEEEIEKIKVVGGPVPETAFSVRRGYQKYQDFKCWECHGGGGKGDGMKAPELKDDWGQQLPPANLTMPSSFKNGHRPADVYRTIMGGLDGGAMPSYGDSFDGHEEDAWHLINYIFSLSKPD